MGNFSLTELALDAIPKWRKHRQLTDSNKQCLKIVEEAGELAQAILKKDQNEIKLELGDCLITTLVYHDILGVRVNVEPKRAAFYGSNLGEKIGHFAKYKTIGCLHSIAYSLKLDLEECANLAYKKIINREGQTIDSVFVKNPEYVRGND